MHLPRLALLWDSIPELAATMRLKLGMSRDEFAVFCGIGGRQVIYYLEKGDRKWHPLVEDRLRTVAGRLTDDNCVDPPKCWLDLG